MACQVTATAKSGKYTIETDYLTDPDRNTVLMRVAVQAEASAEEVRTCSSTSASTRP